MGLYEKLIDVRERIDRAARSVGRNPDEVELVAVTKSLELKKVREGVRAGMRIFGENYIQESEEKVLKVKNPNVKWHFIGHLQKNKVKQAVVLFDMIETVDSLSLAKEINKRVEESMDVLIQVKLGGEKSKGGVMPKEALELAREVSALKKLNLKGLMAVPPFFEDPEMSKPYFTTLRRIAERINSEQIPGLKLTELSMGMSHDFEVAVKEGATIVRVGTALFGPRKPK